MTIRFVKKFTAVFKNVGKRFTRSMGSWISSNEKESCLDEVSKKNHDFQKISENFYFSPSITEFTITGKPTDPNEEFERLRRLAPLVEKLGRFIIASGMHQIPNKANKIFDGDPRDYFFDSLPLRESVPHSNPEMIPILFQYEEQDYIGWQMYRVAEDLLGVKFQGIKTLSSIDCSTNPSSSSKSSPENKFCPPNIVTGRLGRAEEYTAAKLSSGNDPSWVVESLVREGVSSRIASEMVREIHNSLNINQ